MKDVPVSPKHRRVRITSAPQLMTTIVGEDGRLKDVPFGIPGVLTDEWGEVVGTSRKTEFFPSTKAGIKQSDLVMERRKHALREMYLALSQRNPLDVDQAIRETDADCAEVTALLERRSLKYNFGATAKIKRYLKSLQIAGKFTEIELLFKQHGDVLASMFEGDVDNSTGFQVESLPAPDFRNIAHGGPGRAKLNKLFPPKSQNA